jgi:hypothetical protein
VSFLYEQLTDKNFQQLCQAVLAKVHPGTIAFPVGQADGGRDSASPLEDVIFQVKHTTKPDSVKDPIQWLLSTVDSEAENIESLYHGGARKYYLISNLRGSAAPDAGHMDRLRDRLRSKLSHLEDISIIPWWRDTLDSHIRGDLGLQWSFPQMLTGTQALALLVGQLDQRARARQESAIKGYLATEYEATRLLRFKQVGLETTPLTALFVDTPVSPSKAAFVGSSPQWLDMLTGIPSPEDTEALQDVLGDDNSVYAADLLLSRFPVNRLIVSGGPGQGKSTLMQYVCQLHRSRLLDERELEVPDSHLSAPLRLPIHADLGQFGSWLRSHSGASLEKYLAGLIESGSGGASFTVDDFNEVVAERPTLIALDALDEVPNRELRAQVISAIEQAGARLAQVSPNTVIVLTTRPSFYTVEGSMEPDKYLTLELLRLPQHISDAYIEKWLSVRALNRTDEDNLRRLWADRKNDQHIGSLTVNVMQLSILLYLMHIRGPSLPDQRTQLYDEYTRMLLDRESEKDKRVASSREQLLEIHGYVAFYLQAASERDGFSGAVSEAELFRLIRDYQAAAGYTTDVSDLFAGVQRMVALVANQRGAFEFEVQPLREYFAARFLYDTAPYVPANGERKGQKDDRLVALLHRPYWANVLRFFAGCFTGGELAGLLDTLKATSIDDRVPLPITARAAARELLMDKLFTGKATTERRALHFIYELPPAPAPGPQATLTRPIQSFSSDAQRTFFDELVREYMRAPSGEKRARLRIAAQDLATRQEAFQVWLSRMPQEPSSYLSWLAVGGALGCASMLDEGVTRKILGELSDDDENWRVLTLSSAPVALKADEVARNLRIVMNSPLDAIRSANPRNEASYIYARLHPAGFFMSISQSRTWRPEPSAVIAGSMLDNIMRAMARAQESGSDPRVAALNLVESTIGPTWGVQAAAFAALSRQGNRQLKNDNYEGFDSFFDVPIERRTSTSRWTELLGRAMEVPSQPWTQARIATQALLLGGGSQLARSTEGIEALLRSLPEAWTFDVSRVVSQLYSRGGRRLFDRLGVADFSFREAGKAPLAWLISYPALGTEERKRLVSAVADQFAREPFAISGVGRGFDALIQELWIRAGEGGIPLDAISSSLSSLRYFPQIRELPLWPHTTRTESLIEHLRTPTAAPASFLAVLERQLLAADDTDITERAQLEGWFIDQD